MTIRHGGDRTHYCWRQAEWDPSRFFFFIGASCEASGWGRRRGLGDRGEAESTLIINTLFPAVKVDEKVECEKAAPRHCPEKDANRPNQPWNPLYPTAMMMVIMLNNNLHSVYFIIRIDAVHRIAWHGLEAARPVTSHTLPAGSDSLRLAQTAVLVLALHFPWLKDWCHILSCPPTDQCSFASGPVWSKDFPASDWRMSLLLLQLQHRHRHH